MTTSRIEQVAALRASILSQLDTSDRRQRAIQSAHTMSNLRGGRPSDNLREAVANLRDLIAQGREAEELWTEREARLFLERMTDKARARQLGA